MLMRSVSVAALGLSLSLPPSGASAGNQSGLVHRVSCKVIRYYVAKYSASTAEMWARSHGASDAEIEAARQCLRDAPERTAEATRWFWR